ncbi:hypothetical protein HYH02_008889 [Chlamydomonas schloesseri]|uniref:Myb-like domain-containing protein n=1 Tax=Chlamydomonas schloesseri TaxID=2026947 RepID=A0A835WCY2_9CHLO|nr:hypothetical protein HYH02_008889 [Chlamydomonas schloesseri]|eukprot:KAG2445021.1 hypothetical protein HYH02_008889 [Chlamydomonas schloesseri]
MARLPSGLDARRTRAEWSPEAVKRLILLHVQCGNKWTEISKRLKDDRSENEVKNFFYGALKAKRGFRHPLLQAYARALPVTVDKGGPDAKSRTAAYKYAKQLMASEAGEPFDDRSFDATLDVERELAAIGAQADVMAVNAAGPSFGGRYDVAIGGATASGGGGGGGYDHIGLRAVGSAGDLHGGGLGGAAHRLPLQPFDALLPRVGGGGGAGDLPPVAGAGASLLPSLRLAGLDPDAPAGSSAHAHMMMARPPVALPAPHSQHQQQQRQSLPVQQYGSGSDAGGGPPLLLPPATHRLSDEGPELSAGWREGPYGGAGGGVGDRSRVMAALELCGEGRPPVDSGAPAGAWGPGFPPRAHRQSGPLLPRAGSSQGLQQQPLQPLQPRYSDRDPADLDHQWSGGVQNAAAGPLPAGGYNIGGYGFRRSDEPQQWAQQQEPALPGLAAGRGQQQQQQQAAAGFPGSSAFGGGGEGGDGGGSGGGPGGPAGPPHPFGAFSDLLEGAMPGAAGSDAPPGHLVGSPPGPGPGPARLSQQHSLPQRHYSGGMGGGGGSGVVGDAAGPPLLLPLHAHVDSAAANWDSAERDHHTGGLGPRAPPFPRQQQQQQHPPYGGGSFGAGPEPVRDPYGGGGGGHAAPPPQGPGSRTSSGPQPHFQHPQPHPQQQHPQQPHTGQQPQPQPQPLPQRGDPGVQRILSDVRESRQRWGDEDLVWQAMQARRRQHQLLLLQHRQQLQQQLQQQPHQHYQQRQQQQLDPQLGAGMGLGGLGPGGEVQGGQPHQSGQQQQQQQHHQRQPVQSPFELPWPGPEDQDVGRGVTGLGPLTLPAPPWPMGQQQQQQQQDQQRQAPGRFPPLAPFAVSAGGPGEGMAPPPPAQPHDQQGPSQHLNPQQHPQAFGASGPGTMPPPPYGQDPGALGPMGAPAEQPPPPPYDVLSDAAAAPQFPLTLPPLHPQAQPPPQSAAVQVPAAAPHPAQAPATSGLQVSSGSDLFVPGTYGGGTSDEGTRFGATRLPGADSPSDMGLGLGLGGGPQQRQPHHHQGGAGAAGHMAQPPPSLPPLGAGGVSSGAGGGPALTGGDTGGGGFGADTPGPGASFGGGYTPSDGGFEGWGPASGTMPPPQQQPHNQQQQQQ